MTYKPGSHVWYDLILEMRIQSFHQFSGWDMRIHRCLAKRCCAWGLQSLGMLSTPLCRWGCFRGRTPTLSWCLIPSSLSILTDRQTKTTPSPWTSWKRGFLCVQKALIMCPRLSAKAPLGHRVCLYCPLYSSRAESLRSFLYCQSPASFLTRQNTKLTLGKGVTSARRTSFTGRTVWYLTALFLTTLSGSKWCTLVCSGGHEMGHACFMFSKPLLDNVPCDMLLDG